MTIAKRQRSAKRQLGQFITPGSIAERLLSKIELRTDMRILEPSFGDGAFIMPILYRLVKLYTGNTRDRLAQALTRNLYGVELDKKLYNRCLHRIESECGPLPAEHNLIRGDFFRHEFTGEWRWGTNGLDDRLAFDLVVGTPPFWRHI